MNKNRLGLQRKVHASVGNTNRFLQRLHGSEDPIKELGAGISTYHQLLVTLFCLFFILCLLHIPVIRTFREHSFYDADAGFFAGSSLGNLGFSKTDCQSSTLIEGSNHALACATGTISHLVAWGIMTRFEDHFQCKRSPTGFCNRFLRDDQMLQLFTEDCVGTSSCTVNDLRQFVQPSGSQLCSEASARFFIQYQCK